MEAKRAGVAVAIILKNAEGKVLLGRRPEKMDHSSFVEEQGTWTLPITEIAYGEEFEQAAARAAMEQAGIRVDFSRPSAVNNDKTDNAHFATIAMVSDRWVGEPKVKDSTKFAEWAWFSLDDSPFPIFIPSAKALMCIKKGKFNFSL